jgi:RNA polymerase sigma-70 factor (family 1)
MTAYSKFTDEQLVAFLKNGDDRAFAEIYRRYADKLAGFAASKLFNLDDARDILHDIFVKLWENRGEIHITANLQSYLFAIVRHRIIDKIRKNVTREEYAAVRQSLANVFSESLEEEIEARELKAAINKSLDQLSPRVKEVYKLSREEGLSNREIAEKLNVSEQTVKNQLTTALKHLRESLACVLALGFIFWW